MKANKKKLEIAMATACVNPYDLCRAVEIQYATYQRITSCKNDNHASIVKIAQLLKVPVVQIIEY